MRIVRYPLQLTEYQQIQPLWPGVIVSVAACKYGDDGLELHTEDYRADLWCIHEDNDISITVTAAPILGVWMIPDGSDFPAEMVDAVARFRGTIDLRPMLRSALHVFTAKIGTYNPDLPLDTTTMSVSEIVKEVRWRAESMQRESGDLF